MVDLVQVDLFVMQEHHVAIFHALHQMKMRKRKMRIEL